MNSICVFGDSIAWGLSDFENGGWVEMLRSLVFQKYNRDLYNLGVDGETINGISNRIEQETKVRETSEIILAIGINDTQFKKNTAQPDLPLDTFTSQIDELIQKAKQLVSKIYFVGLTPVEDVKVQPFPWSTTGKCYGNVIVRQYDEVIEKICKQEQIKYIKVFDLLTNTDLADGLHPNTQGHKKLFEKIRSELNI